VLPATKQFDLVLGIDLHVVVPPPPAPPLPMPTPFTGLFQFQYDTEEQLVALVNEHGLAYRFELGPTGHVDVERGFDGLTRRYRPIAPAAWCASTAPPSAGPSTSTTSADA
jgi:hypothetical protein